MMYPCEPRTLTPGAVRRGDGEVGRSATGVGEKERPAQSLEPPWGRASRLQRCSGSAATEQDLCKIVDCNESSQVGDNFRLRPQKAGAARCGDEGGGCTAFRRRLHLVRGRRLRQVSRVREKHLLGSSQPKMLQPGAARRGHGGGGRAPFRRRTPSRAGDHQLSRLDQLDQIQPGNLHQKKMDSVYGSFYTFCVVANSHPCKSINLSGPRRTAFQAECRLVQVLILFFITCLLSLIKTTG